MTNADLSDIRRDFERVSPEIVKKAKQKLNEDMTLDANDLPDEMDLASSEYLQSFTFRLRGREKSFLGKIQKALIKIEDVTKTDLSIKVTGFQWAWHYEYLDSGVSFYSHLDRKSNAARELASGIDPNTVENYLLNVDKPLVVPVGSVVDFPICQVARCFGNDSVVALLRVVLAFSVRKRRSKY